MSGRFGLHFPEKSYSNLVNGRGIPTFFFQLQKIAKNARIICDFLWKKHGFVVKKLYFYQVYFER
ncbi:hypothetical protein BWI97_16430 [Siphonobacter sp. BAB-5405]|nr:hypothetical protein BWI97_16430 [Siphonobacter sp. BAB-5405]